LILDKENKNFLVSRGLFIGGILLILTAVLVNWNSIFEEIKILFMAILFGMIVWYAYDKNKRKIEQEDKTNHHNDKATTHTNTKTTKKIEKEDGNDQIEDFEFDF
jgi:cbb3-type cytochrome oxidase subunit 3